MGADLSGALALSHFFLVNPAMYLKYSFILRPTVPLLGQGGVGDLSAAALLAVVFISRDGSECSLAVVLISPPGLQSKRRSRGSECSVLCSMWYSFLGGGSECSLLAIALLSSPDLQDINIAVAMI